MTRFARGDGSKGSNKREPEEATPWSVMVQQMNTQVAVGVEDEVEYDEISKETEEKLLEKDSDEDSDDNDEDEVLDDSLLAETDEEKNQLPIFESQNSERKISLVSNDEPKKKKRKKSEKCKICGEKGHMKMNCEMLPEERRKELQDLYSMKVERKGKGTGRKKKKQKLTDFLPSEQSTNENIDDSNSTGIEVNTENEKENTEVDINNVEKRKKKKVKRDKSGAFVEPGEGLFQGFRVKMEDQKRLQELQKQLQTTGMGKQELEATLKKERRIAEKSLARSKKVVCFNCRQPGHMLADCPDGSKVTESDQPASGHCFKCGSLEHTSKDCKSKLKRENAYRFAVCFICKQEGHLAKTCPDNPKGLYPKGGGCIFCGSVEHLKRDCPRKIEKDVKQGLKVGTIGADLEDEPVFDAPRNKKFKGNFKKKKIVSF